MRQPTVYHVLGYDEDRGGLLTAIRTIAERGGAKHILVVNPVFEHRREPALPLWRVPPMPVERIALDALWPALRAAWNLLLLPDRDNAVVHGQSRSGALVALWLWLFGNRSVVVSPHCYGRQRWFYRTAGRIFGDRWVWLSPAMKRYYGVSADDAWHACIPEPAPISNAAPWSRRPAGQIITLFGSGTIVRWKNWHLVLAALARLSDDDRERLRFVHAGDSDGTDDSLRYKAELLAQTTEWGLTAQVQWAGWRESALPLLAASDVAIIPSTHEPMALAGLEALAAGVPLVIANSGGLNDVVASERNALVFKADDVENLTTVFRRLIHSDFLARASITPDDLARVAAPRVAALWLRKYQSVLGSDATYVV